MRFYGTAAAPLLLVCALVLTSGTLTPGVAHAQEAPEPAAPETVAEPTPLARALAAVRDADHDQREAAVTAVLALSPSLDDVLSALDAGLPAPEAEFGWHVLTARDELGIERPYHLYIPEKATRAEDPAALLIDLHGGVSRPEFVSEEQFTQFRGAWSQQSHRDGIVVAMPLGRADCTWWDAPGVAHVRAVIRDVRKRVAIDPDRIAATGFSDGGSGAWYLAMSGSDPFACLLPMNGHPVVASRASGDQIYLENARTVPLFVAMTQDDQLYPGASVLPYVQALFDMKAQVHLVSYPTGGHTPSYFDDQADAFARFVQETVRDPFPESFEWRTADPALGRFRWIEIDALGAGEGDAADVSDVQVMTRPGRVILGFQIDQQFDGEGVRVLSVNDGSTAAELGLTAGDVIVAIDGSDTLDIRALRRGLGRKGFGEPVHVRVRRQDEPSLVSLSGEIAPFTPQPSFVREKPTARLAVQQDGNLVSVTSRGVRRFRVLVSPLAFDMDAEIEVVVNGASLVKAKPVVDLAGLVRRFAVEADAARPIAAEIVVDVPAAND